MKLSPDTEEVATFFAKMLDHEYTTKDVFRKNFFKDWRKVRRNLCVNVSQATGVTYDAQKGGGWKVRHSIHVL